MGQWIHRLSKVDRGSRTAVCAVCGPVSIKLCGRSQQCRIAYYTRIKRYREEGKSWAQHPGPSYRKYKNNQCDKCNFVPLGPCQLDVHHIDGNHLNNEIANLRTLCANCHRLEHFGK